MNAKIVGQSVYAVVLSVCALGAQAVDIETVPVGNPGNAADTRYETPGYGSVGYEYNIGKYEVTAGQYCEFLNAVAEDDTYGLYNAEMWSNDRGCKILQTGAAGAYTYSVASDYANRPANYVSWGDAARFTNWLHNGQPTGEQSDSTTEDGAYDLNGAVTDAALLAVGRKLEWTWAVTSENEWYKAAYYDPGSSSYYDYPTSSAAAPGYVNNSGDLSETGSPFTEGGTDPGNYATYDGDAGTNGISSPYYRTVVGEWEDSDSPYGTFDQGGNVWEWNEAVLSGPYCGLRGGTFTSTTTLYLHASYRNDYYIDEPTQEDHNIGFRVSAVPEPATIALLALGGLAVLRRR